MINKVDQEYFRLLDTILTKGRLKKNRTGVNTIGVFGEQAKFEVSMDALPILTTKKVHFKSIVHELLWFIRGDSNIKYLVDNGVSIWNEWAYERYKKSARGSLNQDEFIQLIKEDDDFAAQHGYLGEGTYGGMWRAFPYFNDENEEIIEIDGVDQLQKVIYKLKTNPDDRRMIVSAWHPYWVDYCALPPCHCLFHFNTEELTFEERCDIMRRRYPGVSSWDGKGGIGSLEIVAQEPGWLDNGGMGVEPNPVPKRKLNLLLYQRSCDTFLGVPFNITSYALLLAMVAHCVDMEPGTFTHTYGDLHIYENHMEQVKLQLSREPKNLPRLILSPQQDDLFEFQYKDIILLDYESHPAIKAQVAV